MPSASYCIKEFEHAKHIPPDPDLVNANTSLAVLHELAWKKQDESALFHKETVRRDELRMKNVQVREYMTVLKWEPNTAFLKMNEVKGILIRDAYCRMIQTVESILWPKPEANESSEEAMDIDLDPQYNPFKADLRPSEDVACVVVSGGPGIGKTLFIVHVLTLCLLARRPVVWQDAPNEVLVFVDEGVYSATLSGALSNYIPNGALYLSDCAPDVPTPNHGLVKSLVTLKGARLLHFAFPRQQNIAGFNKFPFDHTIVYMEQCTPEDLVCCRHLWYNQISEREIEEFIKLYGLSCRNTQRYARKLVKFDGMIRNKITRLNEAALFDAIPRTTSVLATSEEEARALHNIFCIQPQPTNVEDCSITIQTRHIYEMILQHFQKCEQQSAVKLFKIFCVNYKSKGCAGFLLEDWVIGRLPKGGEWCLHAMEVVSGSKAEKRLRWRDVTNGNTHYLRVGHCGTATVTDRRVNAEHFDTIRTFDYGIRGTDKVEALPETDGIGLLVKENQPTYDLFFWIPREKRAIMVQVTVSSSHNIAGKGLEQLKKAGAEHLDLIVVTPELKGRTKKDTVEVYTEKANKGMLEHIYHLTVFETDMEMME
ncbi:uncharacterized protein FOMMEDRAFT_162950 [Fomitiporia mediterranea MF3/22]|uniref:Crinkler (CRN) family protein n=2 Tax=Fomitiporia mediterranea (strain MF3/22) TaxID=694068 RepID=R7SGH5_FOMME|nr:uncharacterized protein FOMMEDRAFT_162950 [Fomitiporia mediterranea MF3/22]EJC97530.1 hypothetical protein FOMMEDRAFT_162950 [Fomitiporia mediterranea MF3/22]